VPGADALAEALLELVGAPLLRERLRRGGLASVRARTWEASLRQLAAGYEQALERAARRFDRRVA
jgi:glycosyltransferase involved in cell wall biosynthesis